MIRREPKNVNTVLVGFFLLSCIAFAIILFQVGIFKAKGKRNTYCDALVINEMYYRYDPDFKEYLKNADYLDTVKYNQELKKCIEEGKQTDLLSIYSF